MYTAKASAKGQIVIPKEIRSHLGIRPGRVVEVKVVGAHIEIHPLPEDPIRAFRGSLPESPSLAEELMAEHRREVETDG